ncbi:hypothetical protein ANCDUO_25740, partial [Ancylostoma duodenale]
MVAQKLGIYSLIRGKGRKRVEGKVQENMTKNKKKKLKKKAKKQRELLESQLAQMEGLTVDPTAIQEVLNSAP